jgi:hypothetical protein
MVSSQSPATTREAMQWGVDAFGRRFVRFRNLVITFGLVVLLSLVASITLRSWRPLLGLLAVVPLCGVFWCRDMTRVCRWQTRILQLWCEDQLDLDVFTETLLSTPGVPHNLIGSDLDTLPTRSNGFPRMAPELRKAIALTIQALNRCQWDKTALVTLAYSVGLASLACSALTWSFRPIVGCLLIPTLLGAFHVSAGLRLRHLHGRIVPLGAQGLDACEFANTAQRLDWGPISPRSKQRWLEVVTATPS